MNFELVSGPERHPVTLSEAKLHLNIASADTAHDSYLKLLIAQATQAAEKYTGRKLVRQTWKAYFDSWGTKSFLELPFGELKSITHIKYTDVDGDVTTWDSANYIVRTGDYGIAALAYGKSWPEDDLYYVNPIEIQFVCGYWCGVEWSAAASVTSDSIVQATGYANPFAYGADGNGTTGASEPTWPVTVDGTVADNGVTWTNLGLAVPWQIKAGILVMIADGFANRESVIVEGNITMIKTRRAEALLMPWKIWS